MSNLNKRIDPQTLTDAISNAIVNVAKPKSEELFDGLAPEQIAANLCTAFNSFDGLSTGKKAAYHDDWVAFVYIIWYLPERIHSAYRIFHTTCQLKLAEGLGPAAFNLVDSGAGTLAGQMGLALHLADIRLCWVPISKYPLPEIAVISLGLIDNC